MKLKCVCSVHPLKVVMDLITFVVYSFPEFAYWFVKILLNYSVISVIHNHVTEKCLHNKKPL